MQLIYTELIKQVSKEQSRRENLWNQALSSRNMSLGLLELKSKKTTDQALSFKTPNLSRVYCGLLRGSAPMVVICISRGVCQDLFTCLKSNPRYFKCWLRTHDKSWSEWKCLLPQNDPFLSVEIRIEKCLSMSHHKVQVHRIRPQKINCYLAHSGSKDCFIAPMEECGIV